MMNYTEEEIFDRLTKIIANVLDISPDEIRQDSSIGDNLGAASIDVVDIIFGIEDTFCKSHFLP